MREFHRKAPFLFFNGNTFAEVGRRTADVLLADVPTTRRRQATSAVAHYIAGVLDRESMIEIVEGMCAETVFAVGDRVTTLKGSTHGVVTAVLGDGRIRWQADSGTEFTALPESLRREL